MSPADEVQQITPDLWFWQSYDPSVKCDLSSCALRLERGLLLIDPILLTKEAFGQLTEIAKPIAIIITNGNHARAASSYRERLRVPVMAHLEAHAELGIPIDEALTEGEFFDGAISIITIPGAGPGEIALYSPAGVIAVGDALIQFEPHGFSLLPAKYCVDTKLMRISLRKLLRFEFEVLTFAHGLPLVDRARQRLETLIA
jgi:hypothetical protein